MSNADPLHKQVREFIEDYLRKELSVSGMQRLHEEFFSEEIGFNKWKDINQEYTLKEWSKEEFQQFVKYAKQFVAEDQRTISEVYLTSSRPSGVLDAKPNELAKQYPYSPNGHNESGFVELRDQSSQNRGIYIHVQNQISVRYSGEINRYKEESIIPFEYDPDLNIIVVESTYPPDFHRLKSALDRNTQHRVEIFHSKEPGNQYGPAEVCQRLYEIPFVTNVELSHIDVELSDQLTISEVAGQAELPSPPEILDQSSFSTDYFSELSRLRAVEAKVFVEGEEEEVYVFKISSSNQMFYTQIRNPPRRQRAKDLLQYIRPEVVEIFSNSSTDRESYEI